MTAGPDIAAMDAARRARLTGLACLGVTAIGWGLNWPLMKILLRDWPPLFARGVAGVAAAGILAAIAINRRQSLVIPRAAIPQLLFASFTNVFAWMGLTTVAMKFISVGEGALIVYTMPIWTLLLAWPLRGSRPTLRDVAAVLLGLAGVSLLLGGGGFSFSGERMLGIALSLAAAVLFALGNILNRTPLPLPPFTAVAWQVGIGCFAMLALGVAFEAPSYQALTMTGFACLVYMTLDPMALCYLTWFATLRRLPPAGAAAGMLLVPAIATVAAAVVLGEPLGLREAVAIAMTLGGVGLALGRA